MFLVKNHYSANFWLSCWSYDQERKKIKIRHTRRHKLQLNTEKNIQLTNFFLLSQQNFSSPYKKFWQAKKNDKLFYWFNK